MDSENIIEAIS